MRRANIRSISFAIVGSREMGRWFCDCFGSLPGLGIITVVASFQVGGIWPRLSDAVKISARRRFSSGGDSLSMLTYIPSWPGLLFLTHLRALLISGGVTGRSIGESSPRSGLGAGMGVYSSGAVAI